MAIKKSIAIIGLSEVALASLAIFSKRYRVLIYSEEEEKLKKLASGSQLTEEKALDKALSKCQNKVLFTSNKNDLSQASIFIVASEPSFKESALDASPIDKIMELIKEIADKKDIYILLRLMVPVGFAKHYQDTLKKEGVTFHIISYPSFATFSKTYAEEKSPFRIVVGASKREDFVFIRDLRKDAILVGIPLYEMSNSSAELAYLASKSYLAQKKMFANSLASYAKEKDANLKDVLEAVGADPRIARTYLDVGLENEETYSFEALNELASVTRNDIFDSYQKENEYTYNSVFSLIKENSQPLKEKKIAMFGVDKVSSLNGSKLIRLGKDLLASKANLYVFDTSKEALHSYKKEVPEIHAYLDQMEVLKEADILIISTKDCARRLPEETLLIKYMRGRTIIDLVNQFSLKKFKYFKYVSLGRKAIEPSESVEK